MKKTLLTVLTLVVIISGCKKEKDSDPVTHLNPNLTMDRLRILMEKTRMLANQLGYVQLGEHFRILNSV